MSVFDQPDFWPDLDYDGDVDDYDYYLLNKQLQDEQNKRDSDYEAHRKEWERQEQKYKKEKGQNSSGHLEWNLSGDTGRNTGGSQQKNSAGTPKPESAKVRLKRTLYLFIALQPFLFFVYIIIIVLIVLNS